MNVKNQQYRRIPKMDRLMEQTDLKALSGKYGYNTVLAAAREECDRLRRSDEEEFEKLLHLLPVSIEERLKRKKRGQIQRVINATGVILHTNLGRAPLEEETIRRITELMTGYSNLELDLNTGKRGSRYSHFAGELCALTGAEDAIAVNNNAAAVLLMLSALAKGKEVVVSRGELVEIGGKFRIPDVMAQSSAILRETGTTNRTYLEDYKQAVTDSTAAFLKVHTSNYRISGFTHSVDIEELARAAHHRGLLLLVDLGSGEMDGTFVQSSLTEHSVQNVLKKGADLVCFSGDKLFGGPQAGILVGKKELIRRISSHPLMRALRIDKFTAAALEMTIYLYTERKYERIPVYEMANRTEEQLFDMAQKLQEQIRMRSLQPSHLQISVEESSGTTGGGSLPGTMLPGYSLCLSSVRDSAEKISRRLLDSEIPILARIEKDRVYLDMRTVFPEELTVLAKEIIKLAENEENR